MVSHPVLSAVLVLPELLPLVVPAQDIATADDEDEPEEQDDKSKLRPLPRRGPEITEIG